MRKAFTLVELLVYLAIFSVVVIAFVSIFITIIRIQSNQTAEAEVETQSQYLLQEVQYYVEQSSLIDMPQDTATTTLELRMANPNADPTFITLSNGTLYLQQTATGTPIALSSNQVTVSNLSFTKRSNAPSHDSVDVLMTVSYNTSNIQQMFAQALQTSVSRVSASTFDSQLIPSSTASYPLGTLSNEWTSVNGIINFSGNNVAIGSGDTSPQQQLEVNGGVRLYTSGLTQPGCSAASGTEGTLWFTDNGGTSSDTLQLCVQGASGYQWVRLY